MISLQDAKACLEAEAARLKALSYAELEQLAARQAAGSETVARELRISDQKIYLDTVVQKFGRLRKRVSVELTARDVQDEKGRLRTPFVYFERFESGRLYPSEPPRMGRDSLHAVLVAVLSIILLLMIVLLWHRVLGSLIF